MERSPFAAWETFYLIVGSAAGAMTGLQFVVLALTSEKSGARSDQSVQAFGTPTVVHFCAVLLFSAIVTVPWPSLGTARLFLTLAASAGIAYTAVVVLRARRQAEYQPVLEDWLWHAVFPLASYVVQLVAARMMEDHPVGAMFTFAASVLLLTFTGIHNAWDAAAYIATAGQRHPDRPARPK